MQRPLSKTALNVSHKTAPTIASTDFTFPRRNSGCNDLRTPSHSCDRDDECLDGSHISSPSPSPSSSIAPSLSCRLVLLTNKAATVCLVCTNPISSPTSSSMSSLPRIPSPSSSSSSLTSSSSYPSRLEGRDRRISEARGSHVQIDIDPMETRCSGGNTRGSSPVRGLGGETEIDLGDWPLRVFLRRSCRFNHDLLRASIMRYSTHEIYQGGRRVYTSMDFSASASS